MFHEPSAGFFPLVGPWTAHSLPGRLTRPRSPTFSVFTAFSVFIGMFKAFNKFNAFRFLRDLWIRTVISLGVRYVQMDIGEIGTASMNWIGSICERIARAPDDIFQNPVTPDMTDAKPKPVRAMPMKALLTTT
jgi:hypothetical protein